MVYQGFAPSTRSKVYFLKHNLVLPLEIRDDSCPENQSEQWKEEFACLFKQFYLWLLLGCWGVNFLVHRVQSTLSCKFLVRAKK